MFLRNLRNGGPSPYGPSRQQPKTSDINLLLLGETGVGKSTFINSFANYMKYETLETALRSELLCLIPTKFTEDDKNDDQMFGNATQGAKSYVFPITGRNIRLIDTPSIGDVRGITQDNENFENVLDCISQYDYLHAICFLLKPDLSEISERFQYWMLNLLERLEKSAAQNVILVFTNTRRTSYQHGQTLTLLRSILDRARMKPSFVYISNIYNVICTDNEAFQFLVAFKNNLKFSDREIANFQASWEISRQNCLNFVDYVAHFIQPYLVRKHIFNNGATKVGQSAGMYDSKQRLGYPQNILNNQRDYAESFIRRSRAQASNLTRNYGNQNVHPQNNFQVPSPMLNFLGGDPSSSIPTLPNFSNLISSASLLGGVTGEIQDFGFMDPFGNQTQYIPDFHQTRPEDAGIFNSGSYNEPPPNEVPHFKSQDSQRNTQRDTERDTQRDTERDTQRDAQRNAQTTSQRDTQRDAQTDAQRNVPYEETKQQFTNLRTEVDDEDEANSKNFKTKNQGLIKEENFQGNSREYKQEINKQSANLNPKFAKEDFKEGEANSKDGETINQEVIKVENIQPNPGEYQQETKKQLVNLKARLAEEDDEDEANNKSGKSQKLIKVEKPQHSGEHRQESKKQLGNLKIADEDINEDEENSKDDKTTNQEKEENIEEGFREKQLETKKQLANLKTTTANIDEDKANSKEEDFQEIQQHTKIQKVNLQAAKESIDEDEINSKTRNQDIIQAENINEDFAEKQIVTKKQMPNLKTPKENIDAEEANIKTRNQELIKEENIEEDFGEKQRVTKKQMANLKTPKENIDEDEANGKDNKTKNQKLVLTIENIQKNQSITITNISNLTSTESRSNRIKSNGSQRVTKRESEKKRGKQFTKYSKRKNIKEADDDEDEDDQDEDDEDNDEESESEDEVKYVKDTKRRKDNDESDEQSESEDEAEDEEEAEYIPPTVIHKYVWYIRRYGMNFANFCFQFVTWVQMIKEAIRGVYGEADFL